MFELKVVICQKFKCENGLDYIFVQIIVGIGGKQILYNVFMVMLNFGDEVIILVFYWVSYFDMVLLVGGMLVFVEVMMQNGYCLIFEVLEVVIMFCIKWVIMNLFLNLMGVGYMCEYLQVLIDVLMCYLYVWVLVDDIYEYLVFDDFIFVMFVQVQLVLKDCMLIMNGVSKVYVMIGWCIGYGVGLVELIKVMVKLQL